MDEHGLATGRLIRLFLAAGSAAEVEAEATDVDDVAAEVEAVAADAEAPADGVDSVDVVATAGVVVEVEVLWLDDRLPEVLFVLLELLRAGSILELEDWDWDRLRRDSVMSSTAFWTAGSPLEEG